VLPLHRGRRLRHDRNEERRLVGRQTQQTSLRCLAPGEQVFRRDLVPARHLRRHCALRIRLRHNASLGLRAPSPAPRADLDVDPPTGARSVNHMVDRICDSTS
jgi:hypothetical protein